MKPMKHTMSVLDQISTWIPDRIIENLARKHKIHTTPSQTIYFGCTNTLNVTNSYFIYGKLQNIFQEAYGRIGNNHNGGSKLGYLGGHAELKQLDIVKQMTTLNSSDQTSRMWTHYQPGK